MLRYATQIFRPQSSLRGRIVRMCLDYAGRLASKGYLAARCYRVLGSSTDTLIQVAGIACTPMAFSDARKDSELAQRYSDLAGSCENQPREEYAPVVASRGERYCRHSRLEEIILEPECIHGTSPLRCSRDRGLIARWRISGDERLRDDLWRWECEYSYIYLTWLLCGDYEEWSTHQLESRRSALNRVGKQLARRLSASNECRVFYRPVPMERASDSRRR